MAEVDPVYIQAIEHRPKPTTILDRDIPLIDLSPLQDSGSNADGLVEEIGNACRKWGFFQVINHGVPSDVRLKTETAAWKFFGLPREEKRKVIKDEFKPMGYNDAEHTENVRDWKQVFDFTLQEPTLVPVSLNPHEKEVRELVNQWPQYPPELREACQEYTRHIENLSYKLMELISLSLGLRADRFNGFFKEQTTFTRLNLYPPCPYPDLALGIGGHTDSGALTVLAQDDIGGLQVKRKADGEWISVKPIPHSFIINVGDVVQVWSNDKYESVEHRVVVNSEKERFSIPFFFQPAANVMLKPLEELVNKQNPAKYREINWGNFVVSRHRSDFQRLNVDTIQIHQFRVTE